MYYLALSDFHSKQNIYECIEGSFVYIDGAVCLWI